MASESNNDRPEHCYSPTLHGLKSVRIINCYLQRPVQLQQEAAPVHGNSFLTISKMQLRQMEASSFLLGERKRCAVCCDQLRERCAEVVFIACFAAHRDSIATQ